ncbi:hypothetical protein PoHVEF18_006089 [Penicillium ochrochloron]
MRPQLLLLLCSANLAFATLHKPLPGHRLLAGHDDDGLVARQITIDGGSNCTMESSCSECYGAGNVLCSNAGCFDPSQGQQCCADGWCCCDYAESESRYANWDTDTDWDFGQIDVTRHHGNADVRVICYGCCNYRY